jgi:hypothetical protein
MAAQSITNNGNRAAYVPLDDGTAHTLEPGASVEVRLGVADFAVRTLPGVAYSTEPTLARLHGIAEASTDAAVGPIAAYVEANPDDIRYAVVGDSPVTPGDVTVIGSDELAVAGGQTVAPTAAPVTVVEDDTKAAKRTAGAKASDNA